ncbi:hypothetical protein VLK31_19340 [Variovorax sp. H27-G14]|uniref:hypothetical protein n=1 Tax=Variovorax sp. H27-G14 TaxID=3111914 RepID=UPI0038FCD34C
MTVDSTFTPTTGRITGTLHKRPYAHPALVPNQNLPKEGREQSGSRSAAQVQQMKKELL